MILVSPSWQIELAVTKMIAGWMAGAVLGVAIANSPEGQPKESLPVTSERVFRLLSAGVVALVMFSIVPHFRALVCPDQQPAGGVVSF